MAWALGCLTPCPAILSQLCPHLSASCLPCRVGMAPALPVTSAAMHVKWRREGGGRKERKKGGREGKREEGRWDGQTWYFQLTPQTNILPLLQNCTPWSGLASIGRTPAESSPSCRRLVLCRASVGPQACPQLRRRPLHTDPSGRALPCRVSHMPLHGHPLRVRRECWRESSCGEPWSTSRSISSCKMDFLKVLNLPSPQTQSF